jgi:UDP-N-acetylglucosamine transferase subunit ALG13
LIFVTIGSMFPFDRLIRLMDEWARENSPEAIFAQIGNGVYIPAHMPWVRRLDQEAFTRTVLGAQLMVAHAGMGSVITACQATLPIVLLPRIKEWGEHTTDHQIATANWLRGRPGIYVADEDADLAPAIAAALEGKGGRPPAIAPHAAPEFIARIRDCLLS